jgi:carbon storage regulator
MEMLVLRRRIGQTILLDNDIEVTVLRNKGQSVTLGITAPNEVTVLRKEIVEGLLRIERAAAPEACNE